MKKVFCIFFCLVLIIYLCVSCSRSQDKPENKSKSDFISESTLKQINIVYDNYGNILQQILFDEATGEYLFKEFTYTFQEDTWVCTGQTTKILANYSSRPSTDSNPKLKIYYNSDLANKPTIIIDNEYVKVSIVKYLAEDNWWKFGYELKVVNKTNGVITIMFNDMYIMDINCKAMFSVDHIDAGKTSYFTLAWDKATLERCHIPYIDNVEFMIRIFDNNNWRVPALTGERILIKK